MKTFTPNQRSEVDIRVAQELKNHQEFVYQTNQSLQNLSTSIVSLSLLIEKNRSQLFSEKKSLEIGFENLKKEVLDRLDQFLKRMGDLESKFIEVQEKLADDQEEFSKDYMTKESYFQAFYPALQKLQEIDNKVEKKNSYIESEISRINGLFENKVENVRKEIPSVEEFKPLRKEMKELFQNFKIDFKGLIQEIAVLKKTSAYDQKKFENIYTLIDRLKAGNK